MTRLPHHKIGVIVPIDRAAYAAELVRANIAPQLVSFGAMFVRRKSTGLVEYAACALLAYNDHAALMWPTLVAFCGHEPVEVVTALDRHYRYRYSTGELMGGYQVLRSRDLDGVMQEVATPDEWIASLDADLEIARDLTREQATALLGRIA